MSTRIQNFEKLSPAKQKLLLARLRQREAEARPDEGIPRTSLRASGGPFPLSFAQERLWFLDRLDPGQPAYNIPAAVPLRDPLDTAVLERALNEVVRRHEALRTTFGEEGGRPVQRVASSLVLQVAEIDLGALPRQAAETEAARLAAEDFLRPFDLARGPLLRLSAVRRPGGAMLLLLNHHHIITDGWSLSLLLREVGILYRAYRAGEPSPLPEPIVQYVDWAAWQRAWLEGAVLEKQLAFWRRRLGDPPPPPLALPTDRPRPPVQTWRGGSLAHRLGRDLAARLSALGQREGATLFMVLLAALQALLGRWAGQHDVVVGSPLAGRSRPEIEGVIGYFLNLVALRGDVGGNPSFRELLGRARTAALDAYANQDVPFERVLEELRPERDLSRTPLFQVLLNLVNVPVDEPVLPGQETDEPPPLLEMPAKFDLTVYAAEDPDGIRLDLNYNADLFDRARIAELAAQLEILLARAAEDPEAPIHEIPLLTPAARAVLPDPAQPLPRAWLGSIPERLAEHARRGPEAVAAVDRSGAWTYARLDAHASRLARRLADGETRPGDVVAVFAHRGAALAAALLGVWRAGAAFAILDPTYPPARLGAILDLACPRAFLRMEAAGAPPVEVEERLADILRLDLPEREEDWEALGVADSLGIEIGPDDFAYLAFTSGSTGVPKGIVGSHAPLSHFLDWHARTFGLIEEDRFSVLSGLAHDPLLRDLFAPLWVGGTLCAPDPDTLGEPGRLAAWMARERVTVAHSTPAMGQLLAQGERTELPDLRWAFFGGDVLTGADVERLRQRAPQVEAVNFYGATETPQAMGWWRGAGALGRGIEGVQLLVLNLAGHLAGIGELGEIAIRAPYLAQGYLGDPAATAERFTATPDGRLYRTGDLGRYRTDGAVTFAGRADAQVKIRGFRVEIGEIEAALARHPAVREAAVILEGDALLAFVVADPAGDLSGLRDGLRGQLPPYMIPAAVVPLERLPLTPNRKIDRRSLARLGAEPERAPAVEAPRDPIEETLVSLWSELLGVDPARIGIHASFFDLGGHSLLATRLLARVGDAFGIEIPLFRLFETPTVAGLAEAVATALRRSADETAPALPRVTPVSRDAGLPLSFGQERLWFLYQLDPRSPAYNLPHALRLTGPVDPAALARAFGGLLRRHEILRTRYAAVEGAPIQVIDPSDPLAAPLPLVDLSALPAEARESEAAAWMQRDARAPFDLAADPPLRARLLRLGPMEHALFLTLHHIASDGWSNGLLVREVAELYRAFAAGRPTTLPDLPVQYADFAAWQRRAFASGALDSQRAWWRERLGDPPPPLDLPTDRPHPATPTTAGAWRDLALTADLAASIDALGRRQGATLYMTLLTAFAALLARHSGQDDLTVGTPVAGRSRTEVEGLIGFFVNTLVIRVRLAGDPPFTEALSRVRETALGAFVHQDVPFEKLVEELQPERDLAHPPLFQVLFALQNAPAADLEVTGLTFHPIPADSGAATFDLTLSCAGDARGIGGLLQYKTDLFDAPTMDRLLGHWRSLLTAAAGHPERRLGDLPLLTPAERHQLLVEHNDTAVNRPGDLCLHELFERQVSRTPGAVALVVAATGEEITYRDLDARAGRLAAWLRARGVGPEVSVGISLERSPELIVALLAVLKAGGAWVPLDPAYPPERLAFLVEDAAVSVLLDRESWPADLPEAPGRLASGVAPDHLAYRIYTSGSTGRPKAVLVPHRAIVHHMRWLQDDWPLGPSDVVLQSVSVSFDAQFFDLWAPLLAGARLILPPPERPRDTVGTAEDIARFGVTRLFGVPPWMAELEDRPELNEATALRQIFLGGQELPADLARRLRQRGWQVVNFYGPSETAVTATAWPAAPDPTDRTVPIGRPLHNVQVHILGPAAEPLPLGVPGELCIGGAGVTRGYAGRPDLTADRFRPHPFGGPGARLYRTGDRVRRRPDGVLEFLGRIDRQVKIRGFRVEPGEIEAVLATHPAIRDAAVVARRTRGELRLIAYAVPREPVIPEELRAWLQERLPEPMIPTGWVLLDALPLTPNGKVDLAALPEPEAPRAVGERVAPRDDLERDLAAIWEDLLDVRPVGARDDFFSLGGHSLLVLRLLACIERHLGAKLPPAVLFTAPTIEKLAALLREGRGSETGPLVLLSPEGHRPPIIWAHAAAGTVTAYADLARRLHEADPDRPVWALQTPEVLPATLEELASVHVAALRAARPEGPYHLAGWSYGGVVAFEIARQLRKAGTEVALLALVDSRAPGSIDLPEDLPSLRAAFEAQDLPPTLFETFRALLEMLRIYQPEAYPGPILLFRAEERAVPAPDDLGWTHLAGGGLEIRRLPGDHAGVLRGEGAERLATELTPKT